MKTKMITYKHLERLLTCQPYFVWNYNINNEISSKLDEYEDLFDIWEIECDLDDEDNEINEYNYVEILKNGYSHVQSKFYDFLKLQTKNQNLNIEIIQEKTQELAIKKTQELLNNPNVDWIVNPVFVYEDLIIKPAVYKKNEKTISSIIHSSNSKLINYVRAYFEICVAEKLKLEVSNYSFYIYDNKWIYHEKNDLRFIEQEYAWVSKTKPSKIKKRTIEEENRNLTIFEKISNGLIRSIGGKYKEPIYLNKYQFDQYIQKIRDAKSIKEINIPSRMDLTDWGENPFILDIYPFEKLSIPRVSGNLLKKNELLTLLEFSDENLDTFAKKKRTLSLFMKKENVVNQESIKNCLDKLNNSISIWYDFEGFSMPYAMLPFTKPYQQLVFQVSVIKTINDEIVDKKNIVIDPIKISERSFMDIIDAIYCEDANNYVVYNKGYENTRLKEMIDFLQHYLNDEKMSQYREKVSIIKDNTYDLYDLFKTSSSKEVIPSIFLWELNGYSSIKKIENYINTKKINLPVMIKPYKELEVQNGLMAMNKAIQRYLGSIGDQEWKENEFYLAQYCENDVKAMIMVYHFVKSLGLSNESN